MFIPKGNFDTIEDDTSEKRKMDIEARSVEGQIICMAIGGFEVAGGVESGSIPETATKVGKKRELRP